MKAWSLQSRLLLVTLLPVTLLVMLLTSYVVMTRFHDLESVQDQQARLLITKYRLAFDQLRDLSPAALQDLAVAALEEESLRSLSLVSENGEALAHGGPLHRPLPDGRRITLSAQLNRQHTADTVLYVQELARPVAGPRGNMIRAWVVLEFSQSSLIISRYESLFTVLSVAGLSLLLLLFVISQATRRWLQPIRQMSETIQQVDASHMDVRLISPAVGDLHELQSDINRMLDHLSAETEELKSSMSQANEDLRETLEVMEVQNIELTLARKEAVEGNRIKSEFLANISHEIRTPLNGIMGFAKLLLKTKLTPRQLDYVHTIQKSSDSLLAIINDVLDLSKIEAGKLVLDHSPMDIEEVIFDVLNMLAPLAEEKGLEQVAFVYDDVPRHLMGDPLRLKQVLTNLVNNAIKFTNEGEIIVRAMLEDQTSSHAIIRFSVTDTGIGLSETARADLFRAFSQGDPSTSRKFGGTGLGLVISKHLVEQMGGEINFDSTQGQGSTFWFTLKAEPDHYAQTGLPGEEVNGRRLLVAEPQATARQMLANMLGNWGADVVSASSLAELQLQLGQATPCDALILSLSLFEEGGVSSDVVLRELQTRHGGAMILLTRSSDSSQEQALYQNSQVAVLSKPINPRELQSQLQQLWAGAPNPGATPLLLPPALPTRVRVLAVDDNSANLRLVCTLLEDLQIDTVAASNGMEAVALAASQGFDLIFMDIQMPGMTGLEATQQIRAQEKTADRRRVPVIALTAHAMANERETLLKSGLDDYVTKPIQEAQLVHILSKWTPFQRPGHSVAALPASLLGEARGDSIVDLQEGLRLAAGKPELAQDMLNMLLGSLEAERRKIEGAFRGDDMQALLAHVHYLHGATRYCGVPGLREAAQALEAEIKTLLGLHKTHLAEGREHGANHTRNCQRSVDALMARIEELILWRDQHYQAVSMDMPAPAP